MKLSIPIAVANAFSVIANPFAFDYENHLVDIGQHTYEYIQSEPNTNTTYKGTVLLVHGFPDLAYGWHYQIPLFTSLGYRVVAPNVLGYGQSSAPEPLEPYLTRNVGDDIVQLIRGTLTPGEQIILGGHDYGAAIAWNIAVHHPDLIKGVFGLAVPHYPPAEEYVDLADIIDAGENLSQGYVLQLREPSFVDEIQGQEDIRNFLRGVFGGTTPDGEPVFNATYGVNLDILSQVQPVDLLPADIEDLFVQELVGGRDTLAGPLHAYRTSREDWAHSKAFEAEGGSFFIEKPSLFICGLQDPFVPCAAAQGMDMMFADLEKHEVDNALDPD